ncbi:MAG: TatD family deoxyribonuclease [Alphaproteobacteria bacterium]|nr:TatD family deoxyribonuclease [Alphaproteobacteria bacterium]NDC56127.1 TatD family deoxyribonuclease [Alphaproteobacteria bacterium]
MLCDSHCHLDYPEFQNDFEGFLARAKNNGVEKFLTIGTKLESWPRVFEVAQKSANIFCSVGIHPHEAAAHTTITTDWLVDETKKPKVVAIGECGLDYYYHHSPVDIQQEVFRRHIRAAARCDLPLVIHTRDAEEDTIRILKEESEKSGAVIRGVLHCFTGSRWLAEQGLALGLYVSFSGIVTFKKSDELRAIAQSVPHDRLLIETDAPYLAPEPYRGKKNEPAFVRHVAEKLADVRGQSFGDMARITTQNFHRLFSRVAA